MDKKTILGWLSISSRIAGLLVLIPLALKSLTEGDFLFWQLMQSFVILGIALDFGLTPTFSRYFSYAKGKSLNEQHQELNDLYAILNSIILHKILPLIISISFLAVLFLYQQVFSSLEYFLTYSCYPLVIIFQVLVNSRIGILVGINRIKFSRIYEILFNIIQISVLIFILLSTKSVLYVAITHLSTLAISILILNKIIELHGINKGKVDFDTQSNLTSVIYESGLGIFLSQLFIQGPPIIMASLIEPKALSEYLIYLRLIQVVCQLSSVFIYQALPQINIYEQRKEYDMQIRLIKSNLLKTTSSFFLFGFLIYIIAPYVFILLSNDYELNA